mmetsp:Transcript_14444/g.31292  ORF Transcript_14444/g.31292 Transcript_14444/m.31292 type:complete len:92 (-) Transcript_14444:135-410(-)
MVHRDAPATCDGDKHAAVRSGCPTYNQGLDYRARLAEEALQGQPRRWLLRGQLRGMTMRMTMMMSNYPNYIHLPPVLTLRSTNTRRHRRRP